VKWFDAERGYGFIKRQGGSDVYVHIREVWQAGFDRLEEGQAVTFTIRMNAKGPRAQEIDRADKDVPGGSELTTMETDFTLDADYLAEGYFQDEEKTYLRPELLDELALDVAKALGTADPELSLKDLRRLLDKARAIVAKLDRGGSFSEMRQDILGLTREAADQVEEELAPRAFQVFVERNVSVAAEDEHRFRHGLLPHLESVVAYFVYLFPE
jgi:CspA family cold shock protein